MFQAPFPPKGRCQEQFCWWKSSTEPFAVGEATLFNGLFQLRPYAFVVTRLIIQPLVEKLDCHRVLGRLCHSSGFHSLYCFDVLLFIYSSPGGYVAQQDCGLWCPRQGPGPGDAHQKCRNSGRRPASAATNCTRALPFSFREDSVWYTCADLR
jgi:hypothetical protein